MIKILIILLAIIFIEIPNFFINIISFYKKSQLYKNIIRKNLNYKNMDKVFKNCKDFINEKYIKNLILNLIPFYNVFDYIKAEYFLQKENKKQTQEEEIPINIQNTERENPQEKNNFKSTLKTKKSTEPLERYSDVVININNYKEVNDFNENIKFENLEEEGYSKAKKKYK